MTHSKSFLRIYQLLAVLTSACTYNYTDEVVVFSDDAGDAMESVPSKFFGGPVGDGSDSAVSKPSKKRGTTVDMFMGQSGAQNALNLTLDEAAQSTVQFGIIQTPTAQADNGPPNVRALIQFSTSGVQIQRMVTIGQGTSITGSSEAVLVTLYDETDPIISDDSMDIEYKVTTAAVPGSRPSTSSPPTLIPLISEAAYSNPPASLNPPIGGVYDLEPGQFVAVQVPPNVGVQSVAITPGTSGASNEVGTDIVALQFNAASTYSKRYVVDAALGFVTLAPGVTEVQIANGIVLNFTGTITNGSTAVTGSGFDRLTPGMFIKNSADTYTHYIEIATVNSDASLTLVEPYTGTSGATIFLNASSGGVAAFSITLTWGIDG
jgi:hypothetical protein